VTKVRKQYLPSAAVYGGMHESLRDMGRAFLAERS